MKNNRNKKVNPLGSMPHEQSLQRKMKDFFVTIFFLVFLAILFPVIIFFLFYHFIKGKRLGFLVRQRWYPKGKHLLFVYSDSPVWKEYVEEHILPQIRSQAVVINWSERSQWEWKGTLELQVFQHWGRVSQHMFRGRKEWSGKEFCPIAIVFKPWRKPQTIRFWQAFKEYKHGKDSSLKKCERELFDLLEV